MAKVKGRKRELTDEIKFRSQPKLSIGIPIFNGENFIEELLLNLQNQTFDDFEIVICDNASKDRTKQVCLD